MSQEKEAAQAEQERLESKLRLIIVIALAGCGLVVLINIFLLVHILSKPKNVPESPKSPTSSLLSPG